MARVLPKVTVYAGPMGAGKTTLLYGKMGELRHLGIPFAAFKPGIDIRDAAIAPRGYIGKYEAALLNCKHVATLEDIPAGGLVQDGIRTILLEEWFMFGFDGDRQPIHGLYHRIMTDWAKCGIEEVYAAGLNQAASGNQFLLFSDAMKYGADVVLCTARCEYPTSAGRKCGRVARNTQIYSASDSKAFRMASLPDLLPEGVYPDHVYRAVCPEHLILSEKQTKPFSINGLARVVA